VLPGAVYVALQLAGRGVILRTGGEGKIVFGEVGGAGTERVQQIAGAFQQSGIPHQVSSDITRVLWEKFLFIAGVGGVSERDRLLVTPPDTLQERAVVRILASPTCGKLITGETLLIAGGLR